ncbi:hypothetical protein [Pararhizobium sp. A13]|uniref:hypothetical protein n=1 Tax=Pararhizobium sp. A13 TaxID=3133975 RepID=UPI00311ABE34
MSGDDRRIIVVEDDRKAMDGIATVFGVVFVVVMGIAVIDHALTLAWSAVCAWLN